jgi:hypothetical protein
LAIGVGAADSAGVSFRDEGHPGVHDGATSDTPLKGHAMTAEAVISLLTVQDATRAYREARDRVRMHQNGYDRLRRGRDILATTRARAEWGLAVLEFVDANVALAEAEDRRNPSWAAMKSGRKMFGITKPSHALCEKAWQDYQEIRKTGSVTAIDAARARWREEFVTWFQDLATLRAKEDAQHAQELRGRLDDSERLDADDAFPRQRSRASELVHAAREREREESIRRDGLRNQVGLEGWRPARSG